MAKYHIIETVYNPDSAAIGSMRILELYAAVQVRLYFFLLESDLICGSIGLFVLTNDVRPAVVLASGLTHSGDAEVRETESNLDYETILAAIHEIAPVGVREFVCR